MDHLTDAETKRIIAIAAQTARTDYSSPTIQLADALASSTGADFQAVAQAVDAGV